MNANPLLPNLVLLAATLPAQVVTATATGTLGIGWQGSGPPQSVTLPVSGAAANVQVPGVGSVVFAAGPTTTLTVEALQPPMPGAGWWSSAGGDVRVEYVASAPVAGLLRLQLNPTCVAVPPTIDVEDDGVAEAQFPFAVGTIDVPVVLGPRPVPVRIRAQVFNGGAPGCTYTPSITFVPQPAQLVTAAVPCGVTAAASLRVPATAPGLLTLHVADATSVLAALAFGSTPTPPGPTCGPALLADGWFFLTPGPGGIDVPIPLSTGLVGSVELQYVGLLLPFQLQWSNRITLTLP